jgi:hypothetical protein
VTLVQNAYFVQIWPCSNFEKLVPQPEVRIETEEEGLAQEFFLMGEEQKLAYRGARRTRKKKSVVGDN